LAALFVMRHGQISLAFFALLPFAAIISLIFISRWAVRQARAKIHARTPHSVDLPHSTVMRALIFLFVLMFSKQVYTMSISNFFTFYLMEKFGVSTETSQMYLFLFLGAAALGTFAGGPIGDRFGRKWVIWLSILGAAPFALALPYVGNIATAVLVILIGLIMASSFSAILVFAQELMPGHVGAIAGLFFGLSFGLGGIGSAVLGKLADGQGLSFVYQVCSFLPLLGLLTIFLPNEKKIRQARLARQTEGRQH
jgi:FSR family fosmidomycin resistance protein-like MFS transporter